MDRFTIWDCESILKRKRLRSLVKNKIYAVLHPSGLKEFYTTWPECQKVVSGLSNVVYKGFPHRQAAENWLAQRTSSQPPPENAPRIYVDGAFSPRCDYAGWGFVVVENGTEVEARNGLTDAPAKSRNIDGELKAALEAARWAKSAYGGQKQVIIVHDYSGIAHWALGEWKAKSPVARDYQDQIKEHLPYLFFEKIKAHSDDRWNDRADALANQALGELPTRPN